MAKAKSRPADLLDRRQRVAAAMIALAVAYPVDMRQFSLLMKDVTKIAPDGISVEELELSSDRLGMLRKAREVLDEMINWLEGNF